MKDTHAIVACGLACFVHCARLRLHVRSLTTVYFQNVQCMICQIVDAAVSRFNVIVLDFDTKLLLVHDSLTNTSILRFFFSNFAFPLVVEVKSVD